MRWGRLRVRPRDGVLPLAFVIAPLFDRCALLVDEHVSPAVFDLRGFVVDAFVAVLVATIATLVFGQRRAVVAMLVPWSVLNHASYEFTKTMDAVPPWQSIRYLGDSIFLRGSAFAPSRPVLLALAIIAPSALVLVALRPRAATQRRRVEAALALAPALVASAIATLAWPARHDILVWRQTDFVASNAADLIVSATGAAPAELPPLLPEQEAALDRYFRADLSGSIVVPRLPKNTNVLLVLIEGISGTDLPSVAELHRHPGFASMPELDAIGRRNVFFRSFVTHHRGTNRGLYASLCGSYDKLGTATAKMTEIAGGQADVECLPAALRREGYETVYVQAAPLAFMLKDTFMPKIGFSRAIGGEAFDRWNARSNWGVDDRAFFERTREIVRELHARGSPWMMTTLTVGTHHPYPVPDSFVSPEPRGSYRRAARYTDAAVAELVRGLEADGILDDTLVLISSDESHGLDEGGDDLTKLIAQNLSFLVAILPTRQQRVVDELFAQSDTALSVLDVLGLADERRPFIGRSAFRTYPERRHVFVANQNARTVGMIGSSQRNVWTCDERFAACDHLRVYGGSFVSEERTVTRASPEDVAFLHAAQARAAGEEASPFRELRLASDRVVPVLATDEQLVFAGQYIDVPPETVVDVDLEVEGAAVDDGRSEMVVSCDLSAEAGNERLAIFEPFTLRTGDSAALRYSIRRSASDKLLRWVEARATAKRTGAEAIALRFTRATLVVRRPEARDAPGLTVRERAVTRRSVD